MATTKTKNSTVNAEIPTIKKEVALASVENNSSRTSYRGKTAANALGEQLQNIQKGVVPYNNNGSSFSVREAIILCQKAYFNVSIFRNTVDIQTEFANSKLHFKNGSKKSKDFYSAWYDKINGPKFAEQFFRESYRSSNFFAYKTYYTIRAEDLVDLKDKYGGQIPTGLLGKKLPLRYVVLNPADIEVTDNINFNAATYGKLLNDYELKRLKNPSTEQEKLFLKSLPPDAVKQIKSGGRPLITLEPENLISVFMKKQDYEPLAIPMYFPVLADIDLKLEFKKIEHAIARTVDYVVLMVTTGDKDNGVDPRVISGLQDMFKKESVGRVIIADYSTEAQFVIPDLSKVLGPEKYENINRDISNGLMNIFFEDQKFSSSYIKAKIFLERLKEVRKAYINEFLLPEMRLIASEIGIRDIPEPSFEEIDLDEQSQMKKTYTRLAELGILTPEELFEISDSGIFPDKQDSIDSQRELKKLRDEGLYAPIIGGSSPLEQSAGRPEGAKAPQTTKKPGIQKSSATFSLTKIKENSQDITRLIESVENKYKDKYNHKRLSNKHKSIAFEFAKQIISNEPKELWESEVDNYLNGKFGESGEVFFKINDICATHNVDLVSGAILAYSQNE